MINSKKILITGGAGFIGTNAVEYFSRSNEIIVVDNLSRAGADKNLEFLKKNFEFVFENYDIADRRVIDYLTRRYPDIDVVIHLAAQVAVTTSVVDPITDFDINAGGTINILEYSRKLKTKPVFIFASTNKVYGDLEYMKLLEAEKKYCFENSEICGISEECPLDFHSPYGCSKGAADQYVRDYSRIYGIPSVVFRQSCIYGEHQYGVEDQGWLAWFLIAALNNKDITVYGNGKQVRDALYVKDLINAYNLVIQNIDNIKGEIFNIGGGIDNAISLLEYFDILNNEFGIKINYKFADIRPGDQKIFISDNSKLARILNWRPTVTCSDGIERMFKWINANIK